MCWKCSLRYKINELLSRLYDLIPTKVILNLKSTRKHFFPAKCGSGCMKLKYFSGMSLCDLYALRDVIHVLKIEDSLRNYKDSEDYRNSILGQWGFGRYD